MTYYGRWTYKYEEAARQGAAAAIIVHDTFPAAYGWNVVELELDRARRYYVQTADDGAGPDAWPTAGCRNRSPKRSSARRARTSPA